MTCGTAQNLISELLDRRLAGEKREHVLEHLGTCEECSARAKSFDEMRSAMRRMQAAPVPPRLSAQLRSIAARERIRRLSRRSWAQSLFSWVEFLRISIDNLMRPLAVPCVGGVLSALVLFGCLVPTFAVQRGSGNDVPTALWTDACLEDIGHYHSDNEEVVIQVTVDERGRAAEFSVDHGTLTAEMVNDLLVFYRFAPATNFGRPTYGKVTINIRQSGNGNQIVVRG